MRKLIYIQLKKTLYIERNKKLHRKYFVNFVKSQKTFTLLKIFTSCSINIV